MTTEKILTKFWNLVQSKQSKNAEVMEFQQYRQLHIRTTKALTLSCNQDDYSADEQRKIAGKDWTEDCHRYDIRADGGLTMT